MRFRLHEIALVSDIEKALFQIRLQPNDRDVTGFFCIKDCENPSVTYIVYRFCHVPFRVISSPFLLGVTVEHHLDSYETELADRIKEKIYVDNIMTGVNSPEEAVFTRSQNQSPMTHR